MGPESKAAWNDLFVNFGMEDQPLYEGFKWAKENLYKCEDPKIDTCFKIQDWDESRAPSPRVT